MVASVRIHPAPRGFRSSWLLALVGSLSLYAPAPTRADDKTAEESLFVTVRNPITDQEFNRVKAVTSAAVERWKKAGQRGRLKIVFDFNPDNQAAASDQFASCLSLADTIQKLNGVMTVAYVHKDATRHTVLPILACQELAMSGDCRIGNVRTEGDDKLPADAESFYKERLVYMYDEMAKARGRPAAVVLKMLDRNLDVLQGRRNDGSPWFIDRRLRKQADMAAVNDDPVLPAGTAGFYTMAEAQKFGLRPHRLDTRQDVAQAYDMPDASLREDPLEGRTPVAWQLEIRGPLTRALEETIRRRVTRAVGLGANLVVVQLECAGGDPVVARDLGEFFRTLKDTTGRYPVMTVAYVTDLARDHAVFLALGCSEIVMRRGAKLGDYEAYLQNRPNADTLARALEGFAQERAYPSLPARAMVDRDMTLFLGRAKANPSERRFLKVTETEDDIAADRAGPNKWNPEVIKPKGQLLVLDGPRAQELGFSRGEVDSLDQLYGRYGLQPDKVRRAGADWLDDLAAFLRLPIMEFLLVAVGITCLILELKLPGVGLPGVIAALSFILFFWAHSQLAFLWLAVLLFVLGIVLIALEIFVTPGMAVLGVSGVVMLLIGLGLATLERWPRTESEWIASATVLGRFGGGLLASIVAAVFLARYLPNIPYANRLVLVPPGERGDYPAHDVVSADAARFASLLGAIGVTATTLRPAGMVRFGDDFIDVVAEGSYVEPGARVQVIEIEGNRIVVKEV